MLRLQRLVATTVALGCLCAFTAKAQGPGKELNYLNGLMEYYALYCEKIDYRELEETYILIYSGRYQQHEKDEQLKQKDLKTVALNLHTILAETKKGDHEYKTTLVAELGEYNELKNSFECKVIEKGSCLDLLPSAKDSFETSGEDRVESVIARGVLFGKVSKIKLVFFNAEEFKGLQCPADRARLFLKSRTDEKGHSNKVVYAVLTIEILAKDKCERAWQVVSKYGYVPGLGNNYYMLCQVKKIEIFEDSSLKTRLGEVGKTKGIFEIQ